MKMRALGSFLISLLILFSCNQQSSDKMNNQSKSADANLSEKKCELTMGWDPWEPYMYLTPDSNVSGLDIDIITTVAEQAGCKLIFIQDDWMNLLRKVESGEVDIVAGASVTEKRKQYAMFSEPYREESFVLYIRKGETNRFRSSLKEIVEDGNKLGITTDYIYGPPMIKLQDNPAYKHLFIDTSVGEVNYFNLLQNNIDAFLEDPFVGAYNLKRKGLVDQIEQLPITIHSGVVHLMFSIKSVDHTIVANFNKELEKIKKDGSYQEILNKYSL